MELFLKVFIQQVNVRGGDGMYGANPVPTDLVFGKLAGENAASYALDLNDSSNQ
ncbi:hypothetical protein [Anaerolactibacter massiliensis]|uniref:hypothetical protein n=1 Tax=Anaerolactibacter massiliensis TaxID=2044573 RepID=UPI0014355936|nr:hypothetical protein [Anaerolactibacter massiliensis]